MTGGEEAYEVPKPSVTLDEIAVVHELGGLIHELHDIWIQQVRLWLNRESKNEFTCTVKRCICPLCDPKRNLGILGVDLIDVVVETFHSGAIPGTSQFRLTTLIMRGVPM